MASEQPTNIVPYHELVETFNNIVQNPSVVTSFDENMILSFVNHWQNCLRPQRMLLDCPNEKILVVGDVHGDLTQVRKALHFLDTKQVTKVVFNGDVIDRGIEMVECAMLIATYQMMYPNEVIYLRGNHEIASVNEVYGFRGYVTALFGSRSYGSFKNAFQELPLAMKLEDWAFITHGGIPKDQIYFHLMRLELKPKEPSIGVYSELLWNDPHEGIERYSTSLRGPHCFRFGKQVFDEFMEFHNLDLFVRAHQAHPLGYKWFFDDRLLSIFSSKAGPYSNIDPHFVILNKGTTELIDAKTIELE